MVEDRLSSFFRRHGVVYVVGFASQQKGGARVHGSTAASASVFTPVVVFAFGLDAGRASTTSFVPSTYSVLQSQLASVCSPRDASGSSYPSPVTKGGGTAAAAAAGKGQRFNPRHTA